jgi:hypothetical protein
MRFIDGFKRIPKGKRTALAICTVFVVLVLLAVNIWTVLFVHLSFLRVTLVNLFFLVVFSISLYFGLTRGVEAMYDQPSRKYLVRFIYFPLGVGFYGSVLLWLRVPVEIVAVLFLITYAGVRIYFYRK